MLPHRQAQNCRWALVPWIRGFRDRDPRQRGPTGRSGGALRVPPGRRDPPHRCAVRGGQRHQPAGDQPAAIDELERRIRAGEQDVVLLGATGTGKSATTAWLIERVQRPTLVMAPNKTLAAQLANELRELLPHNAVEYFVSYYDYYQPEAYIPQTDTYIEKDSSINDDVERLRHSATMYLLSRRDVIVVASVSCIYGLGTPQSYLDRLGRARGRRQPSSATRCCARWSTCSTPATTWRSPAARSGSAATPWRSSRLRGARHPHRVLRRRDRGALLPAPAHRRGGPRGRRAADLPGHPLRRRAGADGARGARHRGRAGRAAGRAGSGRASCWRRSGCGCAPNTTWR